MEQDLTAENMEDFCNEISILRCILVDLFIVLVLSYSLLSNIILVIALCVGMSPPSVVFGILMVPPSAILSVICVLKFYRIFEINDHFLLTKMNLPI